MDRVFSNPIKKIILIIFVCVVLMIGIFISVPFIVFHSLKSHEIFRTGMELVRADSSVAELFGSPIRNGIFVAGKIARNTTGSGQANVSASISGPKNRGLVQINGYRSEGDSWRIQDIRIRVKRKQVLIYIGSEPGLGFQRIR